MTVTLHHTLNLLKMTIGVNKTMDFIKESTWEKRGDQGDRPLSKILALQV